MKFTILRTSFVLLVGCLCGALLLLGYQHWQQMQLQKDSCPDAVKTYEMVECHGAERKEIYAKLEKTYAQFMATQSPKGKKSLAKARHAWEAYKKQQCDFEVIGMQHTNMHELLWVLCDAAEASSYTERLDEQLHCEEGVIGCGGDQSDE